ASGGIIFDGGTLQTSAGITSARAITVNAGGGTFDGNGFDSTLSGSVSGTGVFTKAGAGRLTLTGSVGVAAAISRGTLGLGQSSGTVNLSAAAGGGTFVGDLVITNAIRVNFNTGTFSGGGSIKVETTGTSLANTGTGVSATVGNNIVLNSNNVAGAPFSTN